MRNSALGSFVVGDTYYGGKVHIGTREPDIALGYSFIPRGQDIIIPVPLVISGNSFAFEEGQEIRIFKPLFITEGSNSANKRTVISTLRALDKGGNYLKKVTTNKDVVYYGGHGMIFNQSLVPLYFRGWRFVCIGEGNYRKEITEVHLISGLVFENDDMISKALRKDFMAYGAKFGMDIIVTDLSAYVVTSPMYSPEDVVTGVETFANTIADNIE